MTPPTIPATQYLWIETYLRVYAHFLHTHGSSYAHHEAKLSADRSVDNFNISFPKDDI